MAQQKVLAIVGPTASGKSALAVEIAKMIQRLPAGRQGEIISADSRQVYRGLNIGTGKITKREMRGIPHHLLDVSSPKKIFTANDFVIQGQRAIADISARGKLPIICGGTGFYIDALLGRITLPDVPPNLELRDRLEKKTVQQLFSLLKQQDPQRAKSIEPQNKRRLIRALEIATFAKGRPLSKSAKVGPLHDVLWISIAPPDADLRKRINKRLKERLQQGMVAEAKRLHASGLSYKRMRELGLEYRSLARHLQGEISRAELEQELQAAIWRYARKQIGYWKRNKEIRWFKPDIKTISRSIESWR